MKKAIDEAARLHAISVMGEDQFNKNKIAGRSVMSDFKKGAKFGHSLNAKEVMSAKQKQQFNLMRATLLRISKNYMKPDQIQRAVDKDGYMGLGYEETLGMSYENIQNDASIAVKGVKEVK